MEIRKIAYNSPYIEQLINLSIEWENESSCEGYISNNTNTFKDKDIYIVLDNNEVVAYLYGYFQKSCKKNSVQNTNDTIFEIDEIFVKKQYRNQGIGNKLYKYVENIVKNNANIIILSTATKDYKRILHFYIDELELNFWNARLYKRIK